MPGRLVILTVVENTVVLDADAAIPMKVRARKYRTDFLCKCFANPHMQRICHGNDTRDRM